MHVGKAFNSHLNEHRILKFEKMNFLNEKCNKEFFLMPSNMEVQQNYNNYFSKLENS
jgi:hypothetical protein